MKKNNQVKRTVCLLLCVLTLFLALCAPVFAAAEEQAEDAVQASEAAPATGDGTGALIAAAAFFLFAFGFAVVRIRKAGAGAE